MMPPCGTQLSGRSTTYHCPSCWFSMINGIAVMRLIVTGYGRTKPLLRLFGQDAHGLDLSPAAHRLGRPPVDPPPDGAGVAESHRNGVAAPQQFVPPGSIVRYSSRAPSTFAVTHARPMASRSTATGGSTPSVDSRGSSAFPMPSLGLRDRRGVHCRHATANRETLSRL
jgi:hypothetical protein